MHTNSGYEWHGKRLADLPEGQICLYNKEPDLRRATLAGIPRAKVPRTRP
jgi:hypothetical protein